MCFCLIHPKLDTLWLTPVVGTPVPFTQAQQTLVSHPALSVQFMLLAAHLLSVNCFAQFLDNALAPRLIVDSGVCPLLPVRDMATDGIR